MRLTQARVLAEQGLWPAARRLYMDLLRENPNARPVLVSFGLQLTQHQQWAAAARVLERAVALNRDDPEATRALAQLCLARRDWEEARRLFDRLGRFGNQSSVDALAMGLSLQQLGRENEAQTCFKRAFEQAPVLRWGSENARRPTILVLTSLTGGNTPVGPFVMGPWANWLIVAPEYFPRGRTLPPHDLVFNAISDPEAASRAVAAAVDILDGLPSPVINHPQKLRHWTRLALPRRLKGLSGVRTARVEEWSADRLRRADGPRQLNNNGWTFPLLVRVPGLHEGSRFLRVGRADQLSDVVGRLASERILVMEELNTRRAEGYRKYRWILVGGRWYPWQRLVSDEWKVHGFSSALGQRPELREAEARFLQDPGQDSGGAWPLLDTLTPSLPFDVGGIDLDVDDEGQLLVFEANPTMLVAPPGPEAIWDYRRSAFDAITDAVRGFLRSRMRQNLL